MAILSADKKSVTVQKGDTLTQIAVDYAGGYSKYKMLAAINNIPNPNRIYIGQKIKLVKDTTSTKKKSANSNKPIITLFGVQSNSDGTLFAVWDWDKESDHTESYIASWTYDTGDGVWYNGSTTSITVNKDYPWLARQSTYSIPKNATRVQFRVRPISETYKQNDVDTKYWVAWWSDYKTYTVVPLSMEAPSAPTVEIEKFKLTASLTNLKIDNATQIEFEVYKNNDLYRRGSSTIYNTEASITINIDAGGWYKARCRSYSKKYNMYSDWSDFSNKQSTVPIATEFTASRARSSTSIELKWSKVENATGYKIEYTTNLSYFDTSSEVQNFSVTDATTTANITGLTSGEYYWIRIRATNDVGDSSWSTPIRVAVGNTPSAPTTWSSTTTGIVGESITLYWVHNSEDSATNHGYKLEVYSNGASKPFIIKEVVEAAVPDFVDIKSDKNTIDQYVLDTRDYDELVAGAKITWKVQTSGVTGVYGPWSVERTIDLYAPPVVNLRLLHNNSDTKQDESDIFGSYPFRIYAEAGPAPQTPIEYHVSIFANEGYVTVDNLGNDKYVIKDEEVFSRNYSINGILDLSITPAIIVLNPGTRYTIKCEAAMSSGLTATSSMSMVMQPDVVDNGSLNARIGVDEDTITANITPYSVYMELATYEVIEENGVFKKTDNELVVSPTRSENKLTTTGEKVLVGTDDSGNTKLYCTVLESKPTTNGEIILALYRREFDGSFTELAKELDGAVNTTVIDPHPALDYARYRIVSTNKRTGLIDYYDLPGYPVNEKSVVIQWDEKWTNFETSEETAMTQPPWSGSLLKIPYNIDVSDSNKPDTTLVEYIGRTHPVSYYGTHLGSTATWSFVIPKNDKETLYSIRRLARWMGDVYVREPSGSGYWANITVSFSQKHCDTTIPVTLNISRVEGGI